MTKKSRQKRTKRAFKMKKKAFFINFKGLSLKQIKRILFGRWEPDIKAKSNLPNWTLCDIFETTNLNYNLRSQTDFTRIRVNTSSFELNSLKCLATKIWDIAPYHVKSVENLNSFIKKIRNWEPTGCHCRLCKQHVDSIGYVDTS